MVYLFYLDESGEREYESGSRYFVLCALGVPVSQWRTLNMSLLNLKRTYFGQTRFFQVNQIVEGLLFIPSHENSLIQLADICAYNIYRQFHDYGDQWEQGFQNKYDYFARVEPKLYSDSKGNYRGYGIRKFP